MTDELLKLRGRLALSLELLAEQKNKTAFYVKALRTLADPHEEPADLPVDELKEAVLQISVGVTKIRELSTLVSNLKKDLGEA